MIPIPIPDHARAGRPDCGAVRMGPPPGVDDRDCGTVEMLVSPVREDLPPAMRGRSFYAYYRPSPAELEHLRAGGFIEIAQIGSGVQPFSAAIWPPPASEPT